MTRLAIDPITRIEGHLRLEVEHADGKVQDVWSSGTMFRGIEMILAGRDPRDAWAFAQRACGVCTHVHALASVRAAEDALGITVPPNAQLIRNLMHATQLVHDHVVHFYHLHALDWVDVVSAVSADPAATARLCKRNNPGWPRNSQGVLHRGPGPAQEVRRVRAAGAVRRRLLGPPGVPPVAGGEPAGRDALPRGARVAAGDHPHPRRSWAARTPIRTRSWWAAWPWSSRPTRPRG